ncbi:hypothetical protein GCM10027348_21280 [Hymenobacter tenuis]
MALNVPRKGLPRSQHGLEQQQKQKKSVHEKQACPAPGSKALGRVEVQKTKGMAAG